MLVLCLALLCGCAAASTPAEDCIAADRQNQGIIPVIIHTE